MRVEVDLARAEDAALKERIQAVRAQLLAVEPTGMFQPEEKRFSNESCTSCDFV